MKNAKKLLLLVLSLVVLIGIFAVATLAEETPAAATVVYPDGTTQTVNVGDTIVGKEFATEGEAKLYYGANNTLYKDAGEGWIFTLEKFATPLTDLTVTNEMKGRNIIASGVQKVYYTHTTAGVTNYNTSSSTHAKDLTNLLYTPAIGGSDIKIYADMTTGQLWLRSAHSTANYLDLNGHTIKVTASDTAIFVESTHFAIYSSQPGAVLDASASACLFFTDDDGKTYDTEYNKANPDNKVTACQHMGRFIFGERATVKSSGLTENGKNITVLCKTFVKSGLYGSGGESAILGGTFVQTGSAATFLDIIRLAPTVKNCSFVITNAATVPVKPNATRIFTDCTFVYTGEGSISLTDATVTGTFNNCNFVNITPSYNVAHTYNNCAYGTTSVYPTEALKESVYLAHGTTSKEITVNGVSYALDGDLISDPAAALALAHGDFAADYWMVGSKPAMKVGLASVIIDGKIYSGAFYDYTGISVIDATGTVTTAGTATAPLKYATAEDAAFTYQVDGEEMQFIASLGSPELDGANFVALLNDVCDVEIVMYTDIVLPSGVRFGTLVSTAGDNKNKDGSENIATSHTITQKPYYCSPGKGGSGAYGSVDWDLNGNTVTVAADAKPVAMIAWTESQGPQTNNVLHYAGYANFKLYSSVAGGEYINNSTYPIFGINKYSNTAYLLGTSNKDVNGGDNLTIVSKAPITSTYESGENGPAGYTLYVNGGTYVSGTSGAVFLVGSTAHIKNAKILATGTAYAMASGHFWSDTNLTLDNVTMIASVSGTQMVNTSGNGKTHKIYLKNAITFAGGTLSLSYANATFNVTGDIKAPDAANLAIAYPTAPEGKSVAYSAITIYGATAKICGYYANPTTVTVQNETTGLTENWFVDETYTVNNPSAYAMQNIDGVWYYYTVPAWLGTIDGVAVDNILAAENAGKTVVVTISGDNKELLYFTRNVGGAITYYYGDAAAASTSLRSVLGALGATNSTITFYSDFTLTHTGIVNINAGGKVHTIDLNGYELTFNNPNAGYAFKVASGDVYMYSSVAGGVIDAGVAASLWMTDGSGDIFLGEPDGTSTAYGKNFTVICKAMQTGRLWSNNGYIYGGTYKQVEGMSADIFFALDDQGALGTVRNATFIIESLKAGFIRCVQGTYTNCTFIAKNATPLMISAASGKGKNGTASFVNCYFYNMIPNVIEGATINYTDCKFNLSSDIPQAGGYIAYTGAPETITINGVDYVFGAQLLPEEQVALVNWGFGLTEYWAIGATATHEKTEIDGLFTYEFEDTSVVAGGVTARKRLAGVKNDAIGMSLTLQSQIGVNLIVNAANKEGVSFKTEGTGVKVVTDEETGNLIATYAVAPTAAKDNVVFIIVIGANEHKVSVNIENYARVILKSTAHSKAHNLTYAMVEYVRAMTGDTNFCNVTAPAGYESFTLEGAASGNTLSLLTSIRFNLSGTIAIEVAGSEAAEGKAVNLVLATGRSEWGTIVDGSVVFTGLYVNEFFGNMTLKVYDVTGEGEDAVKTYTGETYTYSLANYLNGLTADKEKVAVQALYNYAYYADAYVAATKPAAAN